MRTLKFKPTDGEGSDLGGDTSVVEEQQTKGQDGEQATTEEAAPDEVLVSIGDEPAPEEVEDDAAAPAWVKEVRKTNREQAKEIRRLRAEAEAARVQTKPKAEAVGARPTLAEFDYDDEAFAAALLSWDQRKRQAEEAEREATSLREEEEKAWKSRLETYATSKTELKVKDFDEAEEAIREQFSVTQQGIILQGSDNPALLVYALGKSPEKLKMLAALKDPVKFAFAIAKLETQVKTTSRKPAPPPPETRPRGGSAPVSGSVDSTLERLREEAAKTGNFTKVMEYKRQQKAAASK